ncbi:putative motility protein [Anaerobacillus isosaccharinicus]|uniref:Putative motility protein n=1 Tax=Anaerobacillus isosaccharinicus TaxID=1532552 RepID=A0A1S2KTU0_9BACI|nr:putative motility protein [Anaerobacillus isosaccharinicus]MBA5588056.1 putative motility protein [Anaerobacillus isosaccharinicus]QOY33804.1 putative motility protein [Anaerobacillus isosaccharinicus]
MDLSKMMATNTQQLQHTLNLSLLKSSMNTQAVQAISMLEDITQPIHQMALGPHPTLGNSIDLRG